MASLLSPARAHRLLITLLSGMGVNEADVIRTKTTARQATVRSEGVIATVMMNTRPASAARVVALLEEAAGANVLAVAVNGWGSAGLEQFDGMGGARFDLESDISVRPANFVARVVTALGPLDAKAVERWILDARNRATSAARAGDELDSLALQVRTAQQRSDTSASAWLDVTDLRERTSVLRGALREALDRAARGDGLEALRALPPMRLARWQRVHDLTVELEKAVDRASGEIRAALEGLAAQKPSH